MRSAENPLLPLACLAVVKFLFALLFPFSAQATDAVRAVQPYVTEGDTWTYKHERITMSGQQGSLLETITVTHVNSATAIIQGDIDMRPEGEKENPAPDRSAIWTSEWNATVISRPGAGVGTVVKPNGGAFRFPMKPGDIYDTASEILTSTKSGPGASYRVRRASKVTRWEHVSVPAGTFKTIVIESEGTVEEVGTRQRWPMKVIFWYSPDVRRWVKMRQSGWPETLNTELLSYKLAEVK